MSEDNGRQRQLAVTVIKSASETDRVALKIWASSLLDLKSQDRTGKAKARKVIAITYRSNIIIPLLKTMATQIKKLGWDDRSMSQRLGMGAAGAALTVFGSAQAGIAALGGAVALPLWGGYSARGATFARRLYEELNRKHDGALMPPTAYSTPKKNRIDIPLT